MKRTSDGIEIKIMQSFNKGIIIGIIVGIVASVLSALILFPTVDFLAILTKNSDSKSENHYLEFVKEFSVGADGESFHIVIPEGMVVVMEGLEGSLGGYTNYDDVKRTGCVFSGTRIPVDSKYYPEASEYFKERQFNNSFLYMMEEGDYFHVNCYPNYSVRVVQFNKIRKPNKMKRNE